MPEGRIDAARLVAACARERGIPKPLPRSLYATDEDPTIRSAA